MPRKKTHYTAITISPSLPATETFEFAFLDRCRLAFPWQGDRHKSKNQEETPINLGVFVAKPIRSLSRERKLIEPIDATRSCVSAISSREWASKDIACNYELPQMHHCFRSALDTANSNGREPAFAASPANRNSRYAGEGHQICVCLLYPKWCTATAKLLTGPILDLIYAPGRSAQHLFPLSYPAASMARRYYAHNSPALWRTLQKYRFLLKGTHSWPWFSPRRRRLSRDGRKRRLSPQRRCRGLTRYLPISLRRAFTYDKWSLRKCRPGIRFISQSTYSYQKSAMRHVRLKGGTTTRQAAVYRSDGTLVNIKNFYFYFRTNKRKMWIHRIRIIMRNHVL